MHCSWTRLLVLLLVLSPAAIPPLAADDDKEDKKDRDRHRLRARLAGTEEVLPLSTTGHGQFDAKIDGQTIHFELSYSDLEGTAMAAHIHFGQRGVNGGVIAFLCGGGGKPACPASGSVTGELVAADVIGPVGQGIEAGNMEEVLAAVRAGATYVNVHTSKYADGEIRGQVRTGRSGD